MDEPESLGYDVDQIGNVYSGMRDKFERLSKAVRDRLIPEIESRNISVEITSNRAKDVESFKDKISLRDKAYTDPLNEVTDLAGVRVVTHFSSDVDAIAFLIRSTFTVDEENSCDYRDYEDPKLFDYVSAHYIVELREMDLSQEDLSDCAGLKCEIQVRTLLQHAWASTAHERIYKSPKAPPSSLQRRFYAMRALLEIADRELESLRDKEETRRSKIQDSLAGNDLDIPLDYLSLPVYLSRKGITNRRGEPITGLIVLDLLEEAKVVGVETLKELDELYEQLDTPAYHDLVQEIYGGRPRAGIGHMRDVLKLADPKAYLKFSAENRNAFHPRMTREMCEGIAKLKGENGSNGGEE